MSDWLELNQAQRMWTIRNNNLEIADNPEEIQCPWCNEKQGLDHEDVSYEDDTHSERECCECGKTFTIQTVVTYDWRTELPEEYLIEQAKKEVPSDKETEE